MRIFEAIAVGFQSGCNASLGKRLRAVAHTMRFPLVLAFAISLSTLLSAPASGMAEREAELRWEANVIAWLNEFSIRRRVTTLFVNRQSPFSGVQEGHVNTTSGNLTFLVRDLVWLDAMPIVMGRVYDSSGFAESDFGPGWKLTVAEHLASQSPELMTWTDASGARWQLDRVGHSLRARHPFLCPVRHGDVQGDRVTLHTDDLVRVFVADKAGRERYRLVGVQHKRLSGGSLRLDYDGGGRLIEVAATHGFVRVVRDEAGRVARMVDGTGRGVSFEYDASGRLARHEDLGKHVWQYGYDRAGRLEFVVDPLGSLIFDARHDGQGRVVHTRFLHQERQFKYFSGVTQVTDRLGRRTTFHHVGSGLTSSIEDSDGLRTAIDWEGSTATALHAEGQRVATLTTDSQGRPGELSTLDERYVFEDRGDRRVLVIVEQDGYRTRHHYNSKGQLAQVTGGEELLGFAYDGKGFAKRVEAEGVVTRLRHGDRGELRRIEGDVIPSIEYRHGLSGRVEELVHGEGAPVRYTYNLQGFRNGATYPGGTETLLGYDGVGNLVEHTRLPVTGDKARKSYVLGALNQVLRIDQEDQPDMKLSYDRAGRLVGAVQDGREVRIQHDAIGRVSLVTLDGETLLKPDYGRLMDDVVASRDLRTGEVWVPSGTSAVFGDRLTVEATRFRLTEHGPIAYDPLLRAFVVRPQALSPRSLLLSSLDRRRVPYRGQPASRRPLRHDAPSNSLFIPPEFRSINCDVCADTVTAYLHAGRISNSCSIHGVAGVNLNVPCEDEDPPDGTPPSDPQWWHTLDYGDGLSTSLLHGREIQLWHDYWYEGTYRLRYSVKPIEDPCLCTTPPPTMVPAVPLHIKVPDGVPDFDLTLEPSGEGTGRFYISSFPYMPEGLIRAWVSSHVPECLWVTYSWKVSVDHLGELPKGGKADPFTGSWTTSAFGPVEWAPHWRGLILGGKVKVELKAQIRDESDTASSPDITEAAAWEILGRNPTGTDIKAFAKNNAPSKWYLRRMIRQESSCRQFGSDGRPLVSTDNGHGLMQLTNPVPNSAQIYDWTKNINKGVRVLDNKVAQESPHWNKAIEDWTIYNNYWEVEDSDEVVPKPVKQVGPETFAHQPGEGEREMLDALVIKAYNGIAGGRWAEWRNEVREDENGNPVPINGRWVYNELNAAGHNYVAAVVTRSPCGG